MGVGSKRFEDFEARRTQQQKRGFQHRDQASQGLRHGSQVQRSLHPGVACNSSAIASIGDIHSRDLQPPTARSSAEGICEHCQLQRQRRLQHQWQG